MKKIITAILSIVLVLSLCACGSSGSSDSIIGKWTREYTRGDYEIALSYEFFENGTVIKTRYDWPKGAKRKATDKVIEVVGTYSILDEHRMQVDRYDLELSNPCEYSINGNTLTLEGEKYKKE